MGDDFSYEDFQASRKKRLEKERLEAEAAAAADPELAAIRAQTLRAQDDTLESSRSAVRQLKDTVQVGEATKTKLYQQGEQLDRIEQSATRADENAQQSYESARDLHKHKGILPFSIKQMFTGKKKKREDEELKKRNKQLEKERLEAGSGLDAGTTGKTQSGGLAQKQYADEKEREIDENLDEMSSHLAILKGQAQEMNTELDRQAVTIKKTEATIDHTDYTLNSANRKIQEFM